MTVAFPRDPAAWQTYRRSLRGIGASDAGKPFGLDPYLTPFAFWEQLEGHRPPPAENAPMRRGKRLEAVAAEWAAEEMGDRLVRVNQTVRDARWPHLFCHPDRRVIGRNELVQIKTRWSDYEDGDVPLHVQAQVQMEMGLTGAVVNTVAVMSFDDIYLHPVPRDDVAIRDLLDRLEAWYVRHVEGHEPPVDDSPAYMRWLGRTQPEGPGRDATPAELAIIEDIRLARAAQAAAEREETEWTARLMESMQGTSSLLGSGFHLTWRRTKERTTVKRAEALADLADAYPDDVAAAIAAHTTTEEGTRPFRLSF